MKLEAKIRDAILERSNLELNVIKDDIRKVYGQFVTVGMIKQVLSDQGRLQNIREAKAVASTGLGDKVALMDEIGQELLGLFRNEGIPLKERIEAAKELRQWTKLNIDTSGLHDDENDILFVIGSEWGMEGNEQAS